MNPPDTPPPAAAVETSTTITPLETSTSTGNMPAAIGAGLVAALISAAIWAAITVSTEKNFAIAAIGVGLLVGFAVRIAGKGAAPVFGFIGGIFALLGCMLGNLLAVVGFIAQQGDTGFFAVLSDLKPGLAIELLTETFQPMDLLFYAIAIYEGFKFGRLR